MHLQIGKDTRYLDLHDDTEIQLDIHSPAYFGDRETNSIPSVKVYSIGVPDTPNNRQLLERPELLDNTATFLTEPGWNILFKGKLIVSGRLEVEQAPKTGDYTITFIGGIAGSLYELKETYLTKLAFDGVRNVGIDTNEVLNHANDVANDPDSYDYVFPMVKTFSDSERDEETGLPTKYEFINRYNGGYKRVILIEDPVYYSTLVPMLKLRYIFESALASVGFSLDGVFQTNEHKEELSNIILFNNVSLDTVEVLPPDSGEIAFTDLGLTPNIDLSGHVPKVKINDFLRKVCNGLGWGLFLYPLDKKVSLIPFQDLLKGGYEQDWTAKVEPNYLKGRHIEDLPKSFTYDHTDDDKYPEGVELDLNGRQVAQIFPDVTTAFATLTSLNQVGKVYFIESLHEYFELRGFRPPTSFPILISLGKNLGIINEDEEPVFEAEIDTLYTITKSERNNISRPDFAGEYHLAAFFGDVVSPWQDGDKTNDIILLIYRGLIEQRNGALYPYAGCLNYDWEENRIGDLSLFWDGADGIYERWWKSWHLAVQRMRPVVYATRLTATDLEQLDLSKKVRIDKHEYLIKRVQVTLTTQSINTARIEYMQIN